MYFREPNNSIMKSIFFEDEKRKKGITLRDTDRKCYELEQQQH